MPALSLEQVLDAALREYTKGQPIPNVEAVTTAMESNLASVVLARLAEVAAEDADLAPTLRQTFVITLDSTGQKQLTGNDNNGNSLDAVLISSLPKHYIFISGGVPANAFPLQWIKEREDTLAPPGPMPDFIYYHVGSNRQMNVVDYQGNPITTQPTITLRAQFQPTLGQVVNPKLQKVMIDLLVESIDPGIGGAALSAQEQRKKAASEPSTGGP
jgi:hypothetical protein